MSTINNPIDLARQAAEDFKCCYGADLLSMIVYGSAADGEFDPKRSDINVLLILSAMALPMIEKSEEVQKKWMKKRFSRPLFMDKNYLSSSLDSFPIEFLAMKGSYAVIFGDDVLKDIAISDQDLRIQAERELKGKWLHLLQEWPEAKRNPQLLRSVLHLSMKDFSAIFQAMLYLKRQPIPREKKALFAAVTKIYALEDGALLQAADAVRSGNKKEMLAAFPAYLHAIKTLTILVDQFSIKEQA